MSKYAPSPWYLNKIGYGTVYLVHKFIETETGRSICGVWNPDDLNIKENEERNANVKLLLAAPDLLEALKSILASEYDCEFNRFQISLTQVQIDKAKAAIAKAE